MNDCAATSMRQSGATFLRIASTNVSWLEMRTATCPHPRKRSVVIGPARAGLSFQPATTWVSSNSNSRGWSDWRNSSGVIIKSTSPASYCARTGRDGIAAYEFYIAFNFSRLAAIVHGIKGRIIRGTAASATAHERVAAIPLLTELGCQAMQANKQRT